MIPGIVASATPVTPTPPGPNVDAYWSDVLLLIDDSKRGTGTDSYWSDVLLLIDGSKS